MEAKHTEDIEEALQDMKGLNQTIFDNSFDPIILMNDAGKIISWNKGAESIFGWEENEIKGEKFFDVIVP